MANTPGGLPYPVGTDFVADGDNAIRALADKLDAVLMYAGTLRANQTSAGGVGSGVWSKLVYGATTDTGGLQPWTVNASGLTINKTGVYMFTAVATMGASDFKLRLAIGTTIMGQTSTTLGNTATLTVFRYMPAGSVVAAEIQPNASGTVLAHSSANPTYLSVMALPYR